jgi:medium-chain acyl-[acyl-carrier-protein] hydrolase
MFCLPHAAGSPATFGQWSAKLGAEIEVWGIHLPGRGNRLLDPPIDRLQPLVEALGEAIVPFLEKRFVFYGHSMGTLVSFELVRWLRRHNYPQPTHLFVSSRAAPHIPRRKKTLHDLLDTELLEELAQFNGTPKEILENPELMKLLLPAIRADFAVLETYVYTPDALFSFPITVFGSFEDPDITADDLGSWSEHTTGPCVVRMLPGDHFFIQTAQPTLLGMIRQELARLSAVPR